MLVISELKEDRELSWGRRGSGSGKSRRLLGTGQERPQASALKGSRGPWLPTAPHSIRHGGCPPLCFAPQPSGPLPTKSSLSPVHHCQVLGTGGPVHRPLGAPQHSALGSISGSVHLAGGK